MHRVPVFPLIPGVKSKIIKVLDETGADRVEVDVTDKFLIHCICHISIPLRGKLATFPRYMRDVLTGAPIEALWFLSGLNAKEKGASFLAPLMWRGRRGSNSRPPA